MAELLGLRSGTAWQAQTQGASNSYLTTFPLQDGPTLASLDASALDSMRGSLQRLLVVRGPNAEILWEVRALPDPALLLAVAGNLTVDQSPSVMQQQCGIVVDGGTGALVLRDNSATKSVILEVLLIVSIFCLLRAWGEKKGV